MSSTRKPGTPADNAEAASNATVDRSKQELFWLPERVSTTGYFAQHSIESMRATAEAAAHATTVATKAVPPSEFKFEVEATGRSLFWFPSQEKSNASSKAASQATAADASDITAQVSAMHPAPSSPKGRG